MFYLQNTVYRDVFSCELFCFVYRSKLAGHHRSLLQIRDRGALRFPAPRQRESRPISLHHPRSPVGRGTVLRRVECRFRRFKRPIDGPGRRGRHSFLLHATQQLRNLDGIHIRADVAARFPRQMSHSGFGLRMAHGLRQNSSRPHAYRPWSSQWKSRVIAQDSPTGHFVDHLSNKNLKWRNSKWNFEKKSNKKIEWKMKKWNEKS